MPGLRLVSIFDVGRSLGQEPFKASPESVAKWLITEYLGRRGGRFNYDPSIRATLELFRGTMSKSQAVRYCATNGNPQGWCQNVSAVEAVADYALANISECYRISFTAVEAGRVRGKTVYVGIKAPLVRVRNKEAFVVVPGFRMLYKPVEVEIDVACSIALAHLARDDYACADFEYLHAGVNESGQRNFRAILGRDRTIFDRETVDTLLDIYVKGVDLVASAGIDLRAPRLAGYRVIDPDQPVMF